MTTVEELKNALKETLEQKGVLNEIRAKMRQSIFEAIEGDDNPPHIFLLFSERKFLP